MDITIRFSEYRLTRYNKLVFSYGRCLDYTGSNEGDFPMFGLDRFTIERVFKGTKILQEINPLILTISYIIEVVLFYSDTYHWEDQTQLFFF